MKNKVKLMSLLVLLVFSSCGNGTTSSVNDSLESSMSSQEVISSIDSNKEPETMKESYKEYQGYLNDLTTFPTLFVYGDVAYAGFNKNSFREISRDTVLEDNGREQTIIKFMFQNQIEVTLDTSYYHGYDAFEWTVYFKNISTENSKVLRELNASKYVIKGKNPVLKGLLGDHENYYAPYEKDLIKDSVSFRNDLGRSCHRYFPYFNLENDNGGALLAIGWAGTWEANFEFNASEEETTISSTGCVDFESYIKPGEKVRTPFIAVVRYEERNEDLATNKWRKWYIDHILPYEDAEKTKKVQPSQSMVLFLDTGRPNSDGSISEGYDTWRPSLEKIYQEELQIDIRWFDAGWYEAPDGSSPSTDWWGTVGTWKLDPKKWPDNSFKESVEYAEERGTKTMVWFEPERVNQPIALRDRYGYNLEWILSDWGKNYHFINNLGIEECYEWTKERILSMMEENGVHIYREDFNCDPQIFFQIGDAYQGNDRVGITENLYYQGHYKLWDEIIEFTSTHGGVAYVDSCASGGGRNDIESMRRGVPFLRSDSDRTTIPLRLSMTTALAKWLPYTGAVAKESSGQLTAGKLDKYSFRASYLQHMCYDLPWTHDNTIDFELIRECQKEWNKVNKYFYKDFYNLTPHHSINNDKEWTVYEYFDSENNSGVIQAFRQANCEDNSVIVSVAGIDDNKYYQLVDADNVNSITKVKGSMLKKGYTISSSEKRTAFVIYINEVK